MKKVAVIGAGYVGLVTAACLAQKNNIVIVIERDLEKITSLLNGKVPFYEPGLDALIESGIHHKNLVFVNNIVQALAQHPEIIFSCVGTPSRDDGSADLSYVWSAAQEIGNNLSNYALIVNKSTVPVGTARITHKIISEALHARGLTANFDIASNPEFLREGDAVNDFLMPDRIIIGTESERAQTLLNDLYYPFMSHGAHLVMMGTESAEMTKYAANAMLATRISFMNQIALLADKLHADIDEVKKGMALDKRIGHHFLNAGIGYGGSCFPKDVKALVHMGHQAEQHMTLVEAVDRANELQKKHFIDKILRHYGYDIAGKKIGIWGLAFKPETDDVRCSPAIDVIRLLLAAGAYVLAYDPVASANIHAIFKDSISIMPSADDVIRHADCLVILTEWQEFLHYDCEKFTVLKDNIIFDGRNCFQPEQLAHYGITYVPVGRSVAVQKSILNVMHSTGIHKSEIPHPLQQ